MASETTDTARLPPLPSANTLDLQRRLVAALREVGLTEVERLRVRDAMELSFETHRLQKPRPDGTPYVDHPLSVALSLMASGTRPNVDLVVAALLHDSVEDQAPRLCQLLLGTHPDKASVEKESLAALADRFGPRAAEIVAHLTNPDFDALVAGLEAPERTVRKNAIYAHHVLALIDSDPEAFVIKFSDFTENALSLDRVSDPLRRAKLQRKYGPVVEGIVVRLRALPPEHGLVPHRARMLAALTTG
ncbi:MAG: Bifunctional (p)ppGpp synthase/hydrolase RelA [Pseudomonadota bacterium]|jgi:(p)ppGpp synthase/HD superfamily hydrolase